MSDSSASLSISKRPIFVGNFSLTRSLAVPTTYISNFPTPLCHPLDPLSLQKLRRPIRIEGLTCDLRVEIRGTSERSYIRPCKGVDGLTFIRPSMSASESKDFSNRLPLINQQRPALFTNSPFRSPPPPRSSSRMSDQWGAPSEINLPSPNLRTPSSIMQIPERQPQPPLRDSFPFTSPSHHISNTEHSPYSPHNAPAGPKHTMTRHGSFPSQHPLSTSPTDPNRPRPPPLRTAHSAYTPRTAVQPFSPHEDDGDMQDSKGNEDAGDGDELTTKGRKRKRLAKACSACHVSSADI